jgi:hypothetical protein
MHDTARCLGYPSYSTRAARERAREATCGLPPARDWSGAAGLSPAACGHCGSVPSPTLPLRLNSSPEWLNPSTLAPVAQLFAPAAQLFARVAQPIDPRPCGSTPRPCGSALHSSPLWLNSSPVWLASPHLAGVGQCPLAIGHGCLVGLLVGAIWELKHLDIMDIYRYLCISIYIHNILRY